MIWTRTRYKNASEPDSPAQSATEVFSQPPKQLRLLSPRPPRSRWKKSYDLLDSRRFYLHVLGINLCAWRKGWKVGKSFQARYYIGKGGMGGCVWASSFLWLLHGLYSAVVWCGVVWCSVVVPCCAMLELGSRREGRSVWVFC